MLQLFRNLVAQRELMLSLVKRDLKVRYKDSALGFFWSLGRPLVLMLILTVVFSFLGRFPIPGDVPYPLFLIAGLLPWMFFAGTAMESTNLLLSNASLIKKVSLNAAVFPAACVVSNFIHFALACVVLVGFLLYNGVGLGWSIWVAIPAAALQSLLCLAVALLCSSLNVFYRDTASIAELATTGAFYLTPVLYPLGIAYEQIEKQPRGELLKALYMLNPMAPICALYRRAFLYTGSTPGMETEIADGELAIWTALAALTTSLLLWLSWTVFRRLSPRFADQL